MKARDLCDIIKQRGVYMKPFLCIDITKNRKNEEQNGKEFIVKTISAATAQSLDKVAEEVAKVEKKRGLPLPLTIVQFVCAIIGFAVFRGILRSDVSMSQAYSNAPEVFWVGGAAWLCFGLLLLYGKRRNKKTSESEETIITESRADNMCQNVYMELGVPSNAVDVDIITFPYKMKKDTPRPVTLGLNHSPYSNFSYPVYTENGNLCIVDMTNKYCIPVNEIKGIRTIKKNMLVPMWNKNIGYNEGVYKQYKITCNNNGLFLKKYHILDIEHNSEKWALYFPNYELPFFEYITGLKAE